MLNIALVLVFIAAFVILISPPVRRHTGWSALVTPLASIIGSGFLVSVPLLASAIGIEAVAAIAVLTAIAFLIGSAIRYNIRHGEPILEKAETGHVIKSAETLSHLALIGAYFISVAYYLVLLAAFAMKLLGLDDPLLEDIAATVIVVTICAIGAFEGLQAVQRAETFTVSPARFAVDLRPRTSQRLQLADGGKRPSCH